MDESIAFSVSALLVAIAVAVGGLLMTKLTDKAKSIDLNTTNL